MLISWPSASAARGGRRAPCSCCSCGLLPRTPRRRPPAPLPAHPPRWSCRAPRSAGLGSVSWAPLDGRGRVCRGAEGKGPSPGAPRPAGTGARQPLRRRRRRDRHPPGRRKDMCRRAVHDLAPRRGRRRAARGRGGVGAALRGGRRGGGPEGRRGGAAGASCAAEGGGVDGGSGHGVMAPDWRSGSDGQECGLGRDSSESFLACSRLTGRSLPGSRREDGVGQLWRETKAAAIETIETVSP